MIYSISYDLKKPGRSYEEVYGAIKLIGAWAHCLESTWVVESDLSAEQIYKIVHAKMDENDYLLVSKIGESHWLLEKEVSDWLSNHL